jgi:hypothetical protein
MTEHIVSRRLLRRGWACHIKRAVSILSILAAVWLCTPAPDAGANVGGSIYAPDLCEYPGIGSSGAIGPEVDYFCDFPTEVNGSHWHCMMGGAMLQASIQAGVSVMMFSFGGSLSSPVGAIRGSCTWRCPDMTMAAQPNPPGAWKDYITPARCKTVGANPDTPPETPPETTPPASGVPMLLPAPPLPPPPPNPFAPVTNPDTPNPDATVNPR